MTYRKCFFYTSRGPMGDHCKINDNIRFLFSFCGGSIKSNSLFHLYLLAFLVFGSISMLFPVVPPFAASLGADLPEVGFIVALQLYVTGILVAPIGLLIGRLGRKNLFVAGMLLNIVSFSFYLFSSNLTLLIIGRVLGGLASGALYPASSTIAVDSVPPEKRGEALGLLTTSSQLGSMCGPAGGGFLLKYIGFRGTFITSIVLMAVAAFIAIRKLKLVNPASPAGSQPQLACNWIGNRSVIASLLSVLLINVGLASVNAFLPLYGVEITLGVDRVGLIIASLYLGSVLMRALGGWLSDRAGRAPVIMTGLLLCTLGILGFSVFVREIPLHLAALLFGLGMGLALPAGNALLADAAPFSMRGLAMGLYAAAFHAGQAFGSTGLGLVAAGAGFRNMYLTTAGAIVLALAMVFLLTRKAARFRRD